MQQPCAAMFAMIAEITLLLALIQLRTLPSAAQQLLIPVVAPEGDPANRFSPVMFIENDGQWPERARFLAWGAATSAMWLGEDGSWLSVSGCAEGPGTHDGGRMREPRAPTQQTMSCATLLRFSFADASPHPHIVPFSPLDTKVSYALGNDPSRWRADVAAWKGLRYVDLYPGIDLEIKAQDGQILQRLFVTDEADAHRVMLRIEGAQEATLANSGLEIETANGRVWASLPQAPFPYDVELVRSGAQSRTISVAPSLRGGRDAHVGQASAPYQPGSLLLSSYLGGNADEQGGAAIVAHPTGAIYVTGATLSSNFPTAAAGWDRGWNGGWDAYVARFNSTGSALEYLSFVGGSSWDFGYDLAVDGVGMMYLVGATWSTNFPTTAGATDRSHNGEYDVFFTVLDSGRLQYSTLLGGSGSDTPYGLVLGPGLAPYIAGSTRSTNFPTTTGVLDRSLGGGEDAFVARLNGSSFTLSYSTFFGGSGIDYARAVAVDGTGAAHLTGYTSSTDLPVNGGALDMSLGGGVCGSTPDTYPCYDAFVSKLTSAGSDLIFSTYLGGNGDDWGNRIEIATTGRVWVAGTTSSGSFPTTDGAFDRTHNGGRDAFIAQLVASGTFLEYGSYFGGSQDDGANSLTLNSGLVYVGGYAASPDLPTSESAYDRSYNGGAEDSFAIQLRESDGALTYATYFGGDGESSIWDVMADANGNLYMTGPTNSSNLPTSTGAFDQTYNGEDDVFFGKLAVGLAPPPTPTPTPTPTSAFGPPVYLPLLLGTALPSASLR